MATKKKVNGNKPRAAVGSLRRLALALVAVLDGCKAEDEYILLEAEKVARATLDDLGFGGIQSIPTQVATLTAELKTATDAGEWAKVASLGQQLDRVRLGKPPRPATAPTAKKSSSRRGSKAGLEVSSVTGAEGVGDAVESEATNGN